MESDDYLLAMELQKEFDRELVNDDDITEVPVRNSQFEAAQSSQNLKRPRPESNPEDLNMTCNLVHPQWETLDPAPDVNALFSAFDYKFFQSRLKCVVLEWSKRMYTCAGICYYRSNHFGKAITIRLSEPLLKLRTRKDLVETLLHEMIHAYCFVLGIREGNGGHGPNFKKIMHSINQVAGTNITVYHTFHDEVDVYKTHWWRCNGICQNRTPFLGYVKRTSNRAPGPNDFWWAQHLQSCGGTFMKIREPEKKLPKGRKPSNQNKENDKKSSIDGKANGSDLRKFFTPHNSKDNIKTFNDNTFKGPIKTNGGGTLLVNPKTKPTTMSSPLVTSTPSKSLGSNVFGYKDLESPKTDPKPSSVFSGKVPDGNLRNVVGFKDIDNPSLGEEKNKNTMTGQGYTLSNTYSNGTSDSIDREKLRNVWANKFPSKSLPASNSTEVANTVSNDDDSTEIENGPGIKRRRLSNWAKIDDDLMIYENNEVIDLSYSDEEINEIYDLEMNNNKWSQVANESSEERHKKIKQEILNESITDLQENEITLIDDDYDDDILESSVIELADTSLLNDFFGDDTLIKDFHNNNSMVASNSKYHQDPQNDIISCPICQEKLPRRYLSEHLDGCVGITRKILPKTRAKKIVSIQDKNLLKSLGYTNTDLEGIVATKDENTSNGNQIKSDLSNVKKDSYPCPVCAQLIEASQINLHLDMCLQ